LPTGRVQGGRAGKARLVHCSLPQPTDSTAAYLHVPNSKNQRRSKDESGKSLILNMHFGDSALGASNGAPGPGFPLFSGRCHGQTHCVSPKLSPIREAADVRPEIVCSRPTNYGPSGAHGNWSVAYDHSLGSTGSLSRTRTPNTHS